MKITFLAAIAISALTAQNVFADTSDRVVYREQIETVYENTWYAHENALRGEPGNEGVRNLIVTGVGKTVDFRGSLILFCREPQKSYWAFANNFGQTDSSVVPAGAVRNIRRIFCGR